MRSPAASPREPCKTDGVQPAHRRSPAVAKKGSAEKPPAEKGKKTWKLMGTASYLLGGIAATKALDAAWKSATGRETAYIPGVARDRQQRGVCLGCDQWAVRRAGADVRDAKSCELLVQVVRDPASWHEQGCDEGDEGEGQVARRPQPDRSWSSADRSRWSSASAMAPSDLRFALDGPSGHHAESSS